MSRGKGREENALRQEAQSAYQRAERVDPLEERQRQYALDLDDWRMGRKGPIDVRNMPGGGVPIALFNEAKQSKDAGRIGRGLATLEGGTNPNFARALDREMGLERDLAASGQLEQSVDNTLAGLDAKMTGLGQMAGQRNLNLAQLAMQRYADYRRTRQPSFLKQFALGLAGNIASAGAMLSGGGGASSAGGPGSAAAGFIPVL